MAGKRRATWIRMAGLLGGAIGVATAIWQPQTMDLFRDRVFDQFQRLAPRARETDPVRVIDIDDEALSRYGQWPWPRHRFAEIVDRLNAAGAAAIVFDIMLAEPDRTSPDVIAQSWKTSPALLDIQSSLAAADLEAENHDRQLAMSIAAAPVVLHLTAQSKATNAPCKGVLERSRVHGMRAEDLVGAAASFRGVVASLDLFRDAASGEGFARAGLDNDAIVRSAPLVALACEGEALFPSLAVEAMRVAAPRLAADLAPPKFLKAAERDPCRTHVKGVAYSAVSEVRLCQLHAPTTADGEVWIHYTDYESVAKRTLSVVDVLDGPPGALSTAIDGRIVMIGASAEGLHDVLMTPLGDERPGVHVHAEIVEQALAGDLLFRAWDLMRPLEIIVAGIVSALLLLLLPRMPALMGFGLWMSLAATLFFGAFGLFKYQKLLVDPFTPFLILSLTFFGAFVVMLQQEQVARQFIRNAFGKFLSPLILERLEKDPSLLKLEGESREITALFSDIRSFTTISERLTPQQVTTMLNQYFTPMTKIVTDHRGLVDKFMGDGMAALWNAPIDVEDHAEQACRAALRMTEALEELNTRWREDETLPLPEIRIGIGLHTAEAHVGNFGSEDRLEYSMIGDMVNTTARLESMTKDLGIAIAISAETKAAAEHFATLDLGEVDVRGRQNKIRVFALIGDETLAKTPEFGRLQKLFETGVRACEVGDFKTALAAFRSAAEGDTFSAGGVLRNFSTKARNGLDVSRLGNTRSAS